MHSAGWFRGFSQLLDPFLCSFCSSCSHWMRAHAQRIWSCMGVEGCSRSGIPFAPRVLGNLCSCRTEQSAPGLARLINFPADSARRRSFSWGGGNDKPLTMPLTLISTYWAIGQGTHFLLTQGRRGAGDQLQWLTSRWHVRGVNSERGTYMNPLLSSCLSHPF